MIFISPDKESVNHFEDHFKLAVALIYNNLYILQRVSIFQKMAMT